MIPTAVLVQERDYARYTNLDDPSEVGLGLLEAVISREQPGVTQTD